MIMGALSPQKTRIDMCRMQISAAIKNSQAIQEKNNTKDIIIKMGAVMKKYVLVKGADHIYKTENQPVSFRSDVYTKLNASITYKQVSTSWFTGLNRKNMH